MTQTKYREEMCEEIIDLACSGRSMVQIAAEYKVAEDTLKKWAKDPLKERFGAAFAIAQTCSEAYYEDIGQKGMKGVLKNFNVTVWQKIMNSRFRKNWTESNVQKIELNNTVKSMTTEEIDSTIKNLLAQRTINKTTEANEDKDLESTLQ